MRTIATIIACLVLSVVSRGGQGASSVTLRSTVHVLHGQEATLADVAELHGPEADRLARTPINVDAISADPAGWRRIDAQLLRDELERAGANWGLVELRGGPCYVRTIAAQPQNERQGGASPATDRPPIPGTVRGLAEQWIASRYNAPARDVDVRWTSATEGLLDHPAAGLTPYFDDSGRSDVMRLEVVMYDADARVVVRGRAEATVRIRREVAVLTRDVRKRRTLSDNDVRIERRWIDAGETPARPASVIDHEATANLTAGEVVAASHVRAGVTIKRGDRVRVRVMTPTVTVTIYARARRDGRSGEVIEFETEAPSRTDRTRFDARVDGPGSAVMVSGSHQR
ncbi:MAG: flagellar basal body P-ring formation chaperone FlgA [Phycisphaerales bacterium JB060]